MNQTKKLKFLFSLFLVIVGIFAIFSMPLVSIPVLGGVITQGILGGFRGKVGPVVGAKWKSIDYMRGYVVPQNPNTTGQQLVRTKMTAMVRYARQILTTILQPFWDAFYSDMSGFNAWISSNYTLVDVNNLLDQTGIITKGTLETGAGISGATIAGATVIIDYDSNTSGNGLATDSVGVVFLDMSTNIMYGLTTADTRTDGSTIITPPVAPSADDIVFIFFYRGTGSEFLVSNSNGEVVA